MRRPAADGCSIRRQPDNNPFTHDRVKTNRPLDLWEWLLKLAVILFVLDVGVRRIRPRPRGMAQGDGHGAEMGFLLERRAAARRRPTNRWRRLLARRGEVRATKTAAGNEARPELFRPQQARSAGGIAGPCDAGSAPRPVSAPKDEPKTGETGEKPENTTSRLLEAKRRAQKRRDEGD